MRDCKITLNNDGTVTVEPVHKYIKEHSATQLVITLSDEMKNEAISYHTLCFKPGAALKNPPNIKVTTDMIADSSEIGSIADGVISYPLPEALTAFGSLDVQVQAHITDDNEKLIGLIKSPVFRLEFEPSVTGEDDILVGDASGFIAKIHEALNELNMTVEAAEKLCEKISEAFENGDLNGPVVMPHVSEDGTLSWSNSAGLENPEPVNIKGPQGEQGEKGDPATINGYKAITIVPGESISLVQQDDNLIMDFKGLPVHRTLPETATDGDVCLYAPANTITPEMSGQRILLNLEELAKPTEQSGSVYADLYSRDGEHVLSMQFSKEYNGEDTASYHFVSIENKLTNTSFFCSLFDGVFDGASFETFDADGNTVESIEYESFEDVPMYYELPEFASAETYIEGLEFTAFYFPYRLVCFQGGKWTELSSGGNTDLTDIIRQIEQNRELIDGIADELPCISTVRILPTEATEGDMCLYSPANTITPEMSGKRIYFDWDEFSRPSESDPPSLDIQCFSNDDLNSFVINGERSSESGYISIESASDDYYDALYVSYENGALVEAARTTHKPGENEERTEYTSIEELPKYFDLPEFDEVNISLTTDAPLFYAPYRLMAYQGGEWQEATEQNCNNYVAMKRIESTAAVITVYPNIYYSFGETGTLTVNFAEGESDKRNEYLFSFTSGETATVLTLPSSVKWMNELTVEPNKRYEISVVDNIGLWCAVDTEAVTE